MTTTAEGGTTKPERGDNTPAKGKTIPTSIHNKARGKENTRWKLSPFVSLIAHIRDTPSMACRLLLARYGGALLQQEDERSAS